MSKGMRFIVGRGNVDHALAAMRSRMSLSDAIVHRVRDEVQDSLRDGECLEIMIHGDIKTNNIHFNISNIDISLSNALGKATDSHPASPAALRHKPEFKSAEPPALAEFFITLFASIKQKDALLGDLQEKFSAAINGGWSNARAQRMYWAETLRSIGPLAIATLKRIGVFALLIGAAKKLFS